LIVLAVSLGIRLEEFWDMTPFELKLVSDGHAKKRRWELEVVAWHMCNTMNVHLPRGKQVTMHKLLPKPGRIELDRATMTKEGVLARVKAMQAERKAKASGG
jgi:hypothetical protein